MTRNGGSGVSLWPRGVTTIEDIPWDLLSVIEQSNRILDWQENLSGDEMPPSWMWPHEEELVKWFDEVKRAREERFGIKKDTVPKADGVNMMANELARRPR